MNELNLAEVKVNLFHDHSVEFLVKHVSKISNVRICLSSQLKVKSCTFLKSLIRDPVIAEREWFFGGIC